MRLLQLLTGPQATPRYRLIVSAGLSGLASTLVLAIVNMAAQEIADGSHDGVDWLLAAVFAGCILVYLVAELYLIGRSTRDIETALHDMRVRLLTLLRGAEPLKLEHFGEARLYESIARGSEAISRNAPYLAMNFRSVIQVLAVAIYIGSISLLALALVVAVIAVAGWKYVGMARMTQARHAEVQQEENRLFESTDDLMDGFKEVRLSSARSRDLGTSFAGLSDRARSVGVDVQIAAFHQSIFGQVAFFFLLGVIVFVVPSYSQTFGAQVVKITTAALFMIGPLSGAIQSVTVLGAAEADAARMFELEALLQDMQEPKGEVTGVSLPAGLDDLRLEGVAFSYPGADGDRPFALGPVDLTIRRGEIVFITGGNGAGKTTLVKLLTGLYVPAMGHILWNGVVVGDGLRSIYRERISAVFSDFHLFRNFHGLARFDAARAGALLRLMELEGVVDISAQGFARTDLSAGQRKRLALIAALLEERPLLVLDEWAADQDPRFRKRFYREILPALRAEGRTVIAITHDDHYFDAADRRLHLDAGDLREITPAEGARP